jgi:hypothetical protein
MKSAREVATMVSAALGGATVEEIMSPHRGRPRAAFLRWVSIWLWIEQHPTPPTYTATAPHFGRERTSVRHAVTKVQSHLQADHLKFDRAQIMNLIEEVRQG